MKSFVLILLFFCAFTSVETLAVDWVKTCDIPKRQDGKAVVLGAERGAILSNIKMFRRQNRATLISVDVEKQDTPVDLYLTSKTPLIWDVRAKTDAVRSVYIFSPFSTRNRDLPPTPQSSVHTDLTAPVLFIDAEACDLTRGDLRSSSLAERLAFLVDEIGQKRTRVKEAKQTAVFNVSSEKIVVANEYDRTLADVRGGEELLKSFPGGYVELNLPDVVGDSKNEQLSLPPGLVGVYQLIDRGVFRPTTDDDVQAFVGALGKSVQMDDLKNFAPEAEFTVTASTELPFGLIEPLDFNLIVLEGVQVRGTWAGCLYGIRGPDFGGACRRMKQHFALIRKIASLNVSGACRVVAPGDKTQVLAAYYDESRPWMNALEIPEGVSALLVLDSTAEVEWLINVPSSSTIESVLKLGTDQQVLTGLPPETVVVEYVKSGVRPLSPVECYQVPSTSLRTSEFHAERENWFISDFLQTRITTISQALTGRGVDLFLEPEIR